MTPITAPDITHAQVAPLTREVGLDSVACNWEHGGTKVCGRAAMWSFCCPGCGHAWLDCNGHRAAMDSFLITTFDRDCPPHCASCKAVLPAPFPWVRL